MNIWYNKKNKKIGGNLMLEFMPIKIEEKEIFDERLEGRDSLACEYCFTNFFIWRNTVDIQRCIVDNAIFVRGMYLGKRFYFMPIAKKGFMDSSINQLIEFEGPSLQILCGNDQNIAEVSADVLSKFSIIDDTSKNDYLHSSEDLRELKGKKFHQKRNHVSKFNNKYEYKFEEMTVEDYDECLKMDEEWQIFKQESVPVTENQTMVKEEKALTCAFRYFEKLGLKGAVIKIDGKIEAFSIGEIPNKPNKKVGIVHFEKGNIEFDGIFQAMNQLFSQYAFADVEFINRQDDMGIPGLRKAKQSYNPITMVKKYILTIN